MEKINNSLKIKLIGFLLFSNVLVYLLSSSPIEPSRSIKPSFEIRRGYIEMKIKGNLMTSFSPYKPIGKIHYDWNYTIHQELCVIVKI